jgi:oxygen-independent coproporphyrinogen III oxidase
MDSVGIYISVPFCRSKCTYCNFASGVFPQEQHAQYIERVIEQIRVSRNFAQQLGAMLPETVDSVYFGGGTPSTLNPELLIKLFAALRQEFSLAADAEITLECAPGQLEDVFLAAMVECGANRVSFGVQSFNDREAAVTGRLHNREAALRDIERVRDAGIRFVNVDLIVGLPYQTSESWVESLETLIATGVDHASVYMLEVDEDSRLGRELMSHGERYHAEHVPDDEAVADSYCGAITALADAGLAQYEISNFARSGSESRHNLKYWTRQPYLGFGLDAHSMLRNANSSSDHAAVRFSTSDDLGQFLKSSGYQEIQPVSHKDALEEAWFLGLRLNAGVILTELKSEFGDQVVAAFSDEIQELVERGLLDRDADRVRLTNRGRLVSNEVFAQFLAETEEHELVFVD